MRVERRTVDDLSRLSRAFLVTTPEILHFPQQMILAAELAEMLHRLLRLRAARHQRWNWVTFCDPATRESSDPETPLTR